MAGNYFHDPRPFYGLTHHNLISMDELFYGRREPPPWYMHQMPQVRYDDQPQRSRSVEPQRPEHYIQREDQYRRPDMRQDIYMDSQYNMQGQQKGQQLNHNQGGNNHGNNHGNNNNNNNNNNKGKNQHKHQNDSDDEVYNHKGGHHGNNNNNNNHHGNKGNSNNHGNKSHNSDHGHGHNNSWSDNKGFHGGRGHRHHRRSLSLTQTILKKIGWGDDSSSSDSSDDERYGSHKNNNNHKKGGHGHVQMKADHKPYTVRFDDQFYGHSNQSSNKKGGSGSDRHGLGEDHGSHGKSKGGGQPQGILKTSKNSNNSNNNNKHGDHGGYSSDEENRGHKNQKGGNQQHGGSESGKKNGQAGTKLGRSQSMDFRVNLCCENCERKVHKALRKMDVDQVLCDQWNNKVIVTGNAKPESVLKKLRSVKKFKDTHLWQYK